MSKTYITSKDYEVYWTLKQSGFPVLGRMVGRGERQFSNYGGSAPKERKEEIIESCQRGAFEFIDPASQQEQPRKLNCIPGMTLDEMLKNIPGGATLNMEEKYVESLAWESNGEAMHEGWSDGVTPVEAILKLYSRIKAAEREELS